MATIVPSTRHASHSDDPYPDRAAFLMARAMAEIFRDRSDQPLPGPLAVILLQVETWTGDHGQDTAAAVVQDDLAV